MNLDIIAAALCGWMAVCVFGLHVVSSPKRHHWMTLPEYVRRGLIVTGCMFTWRSVNFITLSPAITWGPGHINVEGIMATLALTYMLSAVVVWAWSKRLPDKGWDRLAFAEAKERESPINRAVALTVPEIEQLARDKGFNVNGQPPEQKQ